MNAYPRTSDCGFPSDTYDLVDACIERVREVASLDEAVVLPRLPPPLPVVAPRREVAILTRSEVADAAAGPREREDATAFAGSTGRRARWPLVQCAMVALASASASFLASPLGRKPSVERMTHAARGHLHGAGRATAALLARP